MSYIPPDAMLHELQCMTGPLVEPEKIHELDLRAIYETIKEGLSELEGKNTKTLAVLKRVNDTYKLMMARFCPELPAFSSWSVQADQLLKETEARP